MTQKTIIIFRSEIYSKSPKQKYITDKTDVYHFDDNWSLDILDIKDNDPGNYKSYRYILVVIEKISKYGWTFPSKHKNGETIKDSFGKFFIS